MKVLSVLCALLITVATAKQELSESQYRDAFTDWMISNQKSYSSSEFITRYNIFKTNFDYIEEWNSKGSETVLGLNKMADITNEEYRSLYLGKPFDASSLIGTKEEILFSNKFSSTVDWRKKGAVTHVKNQQSCSGCWSFSATGATEGAHKLANNGTNELVSLSEQNLIDCSTPFGNTGCNGGVITYAFEYIISNGGIDTEKSYPFEGTDGTCRYKSENSGATISSYVNVTFGSESSLESAVNVNPVACSIDASHSSFLFYKSGIYFEPACSRTNLDHGVLVVGYGTENSQSQDSSSEPNHSNYWIAKNSWGNDWGINGYILMSKDRDNMCGISTLASFPIV
ncbi:hypothetical protein ACTFIT_010084 [Dictyostelium discoideum]